jgi:hypothetical protein
MNNTMTYKHRDTYLADGQYHGEIKKSHVCIVNNTNCHVIETLFANKKTVTEFFYDSEKDDAIEKRKTFFIAIGHPEWFELENFDTSLLIGLGYDAILKSYYSTKKGIDVMGINAYLPPDLANPWIKEDVKKDTKDGLDQDIPF